MPKGQKGFQKGQASNPDGFLPLPDDIKNARKLSRIELERLFNKYFYSDFLETQKILERVARGEKVNVPNGELMIMSVYYHGIKTGDPKYLDFFLNRMVGQAVRKIQVITELENPTEKNAPVQMSDQEKLEMIEMYRQKLQSTIKATIPINAVNLNKKPRKPRKKAADDTDQSSSNREDKPQVQETK